jgi:hypothetical protein
LSSLGHFSFSGRTLLHGVSYPDDITEKEPSEENAVISELNTEKGKNSGQNNTTNNAPTTFHCTAGSKERARRKRLRDSY